MNPFPQQPTLRPCPECGGRRVTGNTANDLNLRVEFRAAKRTLDMIPTLPVVICMTCGHISLHAQQLSTLIEEIQKYPDHFRY
jgi:DNA-directed RNA polymerase subunit RPC12/RpoP